MTPTCRGFSMIPRSAGPVGSQETLAIVHWSAGTWPLQQPRTHGLPTMADSGVFTTRPVYMGTRGVIASAHYLGARAGQRMFDRGGNAIDAVVASGLALN